MKRGKGVSESGDGCCRQIISGGRDEREKLNIL